MARALFSTIFQQSSSGIHFHGEVEDDEALYFQTVALNMVLDNLDLWNIATTGIDFSYPFEFCKFDLFQNRPNPISLTTEIQFYLGKPCFTRLVVCNLLGEIMASLVNTRLSAGEYSITFDSAIYPAASIFAI